MHPNLALIDYRRRVFSQYQAVRDSEEPMQARCAQFRSSKDDLFANHPRSAIRREHRDNFGGLDYFPYDSSLRFLVTPEFYVNSDIIDIPLKDDGLFRIQPLASIEFEHGGANNKLRVYRQIAYGGGLFLPFRDTSRLDGSTYGGTRYLLDTIKGADLGIENGKLVIDFNFAYNPSCAYDEKWDCPLAPKENWLEVPIFAGEKAFPKS